MRSFGFTVAAIVLAAACGQAQMSCRTQTTPVPVRAGGVAELVADLILTCTGGTPTRANANLPQYQVLVTANAVIASRGRVNPLPSGLAVNEALLLIGEPSPATQVGGVNVFQGSQFQDNGVAFQAIPVDPPGKDNTRILRVTNLRVNAGALPTQAAGQIKMSVQMYSDTGAAVPLSGGELIVGTAQVPLAFSLATALDGVVLPTAPGLIATPAVLPTTLPTPVVGFHLKFSEGFPGAFRRRNIGTSGADPSFLVNQNVIGQVYHTETGFFNSLFPVTTGMNIAGLADSGTRLMAEFQKIPDGALLWVSTRDINPGTTGYLDSAPKALLTSTDAQGAGLFTYARAATPDGYAQLRVANGVAMATWEVVSSNADVQKDFSFSVALTAAVGSPVALGTATVTGSLGPHDGGTVTPIPSFVNLATPRAAFTLSNTTAVPQLSVVPAGSFRGPSVAPDSIVSAFGASLAATTLAAKDTPQITLAGTTLDIIDSNGDKRSAPLFAIAPTQINFVLDPATKSGLAVVNANYQGRIVASGLVQIEDVAPSLFSANGDGQEAAAGQLVRVRNGQQSIEPLASYDQATNHWSAIPIDLGPESDSLYLVVYGTGLRKRSSLNTVSAALGGAPIPVLFAGPHSSLIAVDQVNLGPIPRELLGHGNVNLALTVEGKGANQLIFNVK